MENLPILIILSDLWAKDQSDWISHYIKNLQSNFEITYYDCCELGKLDKTDSTEQSLHEQFVDGGIERAVNNLILTEKQKVNILAFSIGGTIAWKACLLGLKAQNIFAVSSTRLRLEIDKPLVNIELYYGEKDQFQPGIHWFEKMNIERQILPNEDHNFYQKSAFSEKLSQRIIDKLIR